MGVAESGNIGAAVANGKRNPRVIIVGTGLSGVCMGIRLMEAGFTDLTLYEKGGGLGGTWYFNFYPGLRCDVPSYYYQYSFSPSASWSHRFCGGPEIQQYYETTAKKYNVFERIKFNSEVTNSEYRGGKWHVDLENGESDEADILIAACGILVRPKYPEIEGMDTFEGKILHTARWERDIDLTGKSVGVIGNGSTGIQMIKPLTDICKKVISFQRTPQWIVPVPNRKYSKLNEKMLTTFPVISKVFHHSISYFMETIMGTGVIKDGFARRLIGKACQWNLNTVKDPKLRKALTPDYVAMCKRLVMSSEFYPAIQKPNAELVSEHIERFEPKGIRTKDGVLHELDVVALATGYHAGEHMMPMTMSVENGPTLEEAWKDGVYGYRTVAMPDFPNFFMVMGPNSPVGNFSLAAIAEVQSGYIMNFVEKWANREFEKVSPKRTATDRFIQDMKDNMKDTVWLTGCDSWYLDKNGVPVSWPWTAAKFRNDLKEPDYNEYEMER